MGTCLNSTSASIQSSSISPYCPSSPTDGPGSTVVFHLRCVVPACSASRRANHPVGSARYPPPFIHRGSCWGPFVLLCVPARFSLVICSVFFFSRFVIRWGLSGALNVLRQCSTSVLRSKYQPACFFPLLASTPSCLLIQSYWWAPVSMNKAAMNILIQAFCFLCRHMCFHFPWVNTQEYNSRGRDCLVV